MKFGRFDTLYVGVLAWVLTFYFLATGVHDWKLWVVVSVAFAERLLLQLALFIMARATQLMARKMMESLGAMQDRHGV